MYANSIASATNMRKLCLWQNDFVLLMQVVLLQLNFCVWDNETASAAFVTASAAAASAAGGGEEDGGVVVATSSDMSPLLSCAIIICCCDDRTISVCVASPGFWRVWTPPRPQKI